MCAFQARLLHISGAAADFEENLAKTRCAAVAARDTTPLLWQRLTRRQKVWLKVRRHPVCLAENLWQVKPVKRRFKPVTLGNQLALHHHRTTEVAKAVNFNPDAVAVFGSGLI